VLIKPFVNDFLTFRINGSVSKNITENDIIGKISHWYTPVYYTISTRWEKWSLSYQGNIVDKNSSGTYLNQDENMSHFTLRYNHKNISVWGSLLFAFTPAKYITETIPESMVSYSSARHINDNKNMLVLGISYRFSSGKKYEEKQKKINNYDSDSGLFR